MSDVGARIKEAAAKVGGLNKLAALVGIPRRTLGDKLAGRTPLDLSLAVKIAQVTGVRLEWLASDEGPREAEQTRTSAESLLDRLSAGLSSKANPRDATEVALAAVQIMKLVDGLTQRIFGELGVRIPDHQRLSEVSSHTEALIMRMDDVCDGEELRSLTPWIEGRIRKNLAAPGTGKREAS